MTDHIVSKAPPPITPITGGGYIPKRPTIPPADYGTWRKADLWTIERGILLLLRVEVLPHRDQNTGRCNSDEEQRIYDDFVTAWELAQGSIKAGRLAIRGKGYPYPNSEVDPGAFIAWARSKDYEIPEGLEGIGVELQAEPEPNLSSELEAVGQVEASRQSEPERRETEINRWLRETWETEGRPTGAKFFASLRNYKGKPGSPIVEWYHAGRRAGIKWCASGGASGEWTKKTIQTKASELKKTTAKPCRAK